MKSLNERLELSKIYYMLDKFGEELKLCGRVFHHETHAIKITFEKGQWMTVYARNRKTHKKDFEGSVLKRPYGKGVSYFFRNGDSLNILGVPK